MPDSAVLTKVLFFFCLEEKLSPLSPAKDRNLHVETLPSSLSSESTFLHGSQPAIDIKHLFPILLTSFFEGRIQVLYVLDSHRA